MENSTVVKLRSLILKHAAKIAYGFPDDGLAEVMPLATDENLLRGCLKLVLSFGLWAEEFLDGKTVRRLSTGKPSTKRGDLSESLRNLLSEYGRLALDKGKSSIFLTQIAQRPADAGVLGLNLLDLKMCIASARLVPPDLPRGEVDESVPPKDYEYLIHPRAESLVSNLLQRT